ncbi:PRKCA-binding protein-like isoform X2 [Convolutriloba macropyga]|uniref:PRKCA-binding protein-like isoform X2 n=1 Tax=Convolutriloba macropyga TaxID=536237 RepID=UPI003F5252D7
MFAEFLELEEDRLGLSLQPGSVCVQKDSQNLIGISIGGGAPLCPCLYIVQVTIGYNKLGGCEAKEQGRSFDMLVKKMKHKMVENMSSSTADALGLSRAILCNDGLIKKMQEMEKIAGMYRGLMNNTKGLLRGYLQLAHSHRMLGDVFSEIGAKEPQSVASEAFRKYGDAHRNMEKLGVKLLRTLKPMVSDLDTYLNKAIPDTKFTIKKYADVKFEYLSFCLKVKELDDEEYSYASIGEPLYRVDTGNYEYRLVLRCRQEARTRFARQRADVLEKIELLDNKHVQDIVYQLQRFVAAMSRYNNDCKQQITNNSVFPIEVDLLRSTLNFAKKGDFSEDGDDVEDQIDPNLSPSPPPNNNNNGSHAKNNNNIISQFASGDDDGRFDGNLPDLEDDDLLDQLANFSSHSNHPDSNGTSANLLHDDVDLLNTTDLITPNNINIASRDLVMTSFESEGLLTTSGENSLGGDTDGTEQQLNSLNLLD